MKIKPPASTAPEPDPILKGKRIGILDDDPVIKKMLVGYIESWQGAAHVMNDSKDLIFRIERNQLDLLLLDVEMPEISGLDVLPSIRKLDKELPVVILTGLGYKSDTVKTAMSRGASGYVAKQLLQKDILQKEVAKFLRKREGTAAPAGRADVSLEGKWVCVMDDDPIICKTIETYLKEWGAVPRIVEKAKEFDAILKEKEAALIILDIHMPEINGLDLLKSLRNVDKNTPIMILTSENYDRKLVETAFQRGANGFLTKKLLQKETLKKAISKAMMPSKGTSSPFRMHRMPPKAGLSTTSATESGKPGGKA